HGRLAQFLRGQVLHVRGVILVRVQVQEHVGPHLEALRGQVFRQGQRVWIEEDRHIVVRSDSKAVLDGVFRECRHGYVPPAMRDRAVYETPGEVRERRIPSSDAGGIVLQRDLERRGAPLGSPLIRSRKAPSGSFAFTTPVARSTPDVPSSRAFETSLRVRTPAPQDRKSVV